MMYTKKRSLVLIISFLVLLLVPNLLMFTNLEKKSQFANLTEYPELQNETTKSSLVKLKKYYLEHYGLKSTLVNDYINFKSNILDENPLPNRVVKGSNDWYFLGNHHNNVLNNTFGMQTYSDIDLHKMKQNLLIINNYFSNLDINFYFVIPPNKSAIYKENLPFNIKQKPTPLSQLMATINPSDNINIINLKEPLLNYQGDNQLYHKTDTHWNSFGAYLAYEAVMESIIKDYNQQTIIPLSYFDIKKDSFQGDITRMINHYQKEPIVKYVYPKHSNVEVIKNTYEYYAYQNQDRNLKLLLFRDSFAYELFPFFNESFRHAVYVKYNDAISKSMVEKEKPDIVILEVSERNIDVLLKKIRLVK